MREIRILLIASISGEKDSDIEERVFEFDETVDGAGSAAALAAGRWMTEQASDLIEEAEKS